MKIIVFGASGKTGKRFTEQALEAGHIITAFVRSPEKMNIPHPNLTIVKGDATDAAAVSAAMEGHDAAVSALGANNGLGKTTILHEMTANIAAGMEAHHISRIVYTASAGIDHEIPGVMGKLTEKMLANVLADHRNAVQVLKDHNFEWTIARPLGLTDKPAAGKFRTATEGIPKGGRSISRSDVAAFLLDAVENGKYIRESVALSN